MKIEGHGVRLTMYLGENDLYKHRPLYHEIVERARQAGLAGATVFRGMEGFGASSRVHTSRLLTPSQDLPIVVEIVDRLERIEQFLPELDELIAEGLVVREDVEIVMYRGRTAQESGETDGAGAGA